MGFEVETRQVRVHAGAEGFGEDLIIAFFGAGGGVALQEVWSYLKGRLGANDSETIDIFAWLSELDPSDAADQIRSEVARAMDRSSADLTIVELERRDDSVHAVLSASTGERYVIDIDSEGYSLVTIEAEPRA
jgi:hypothetical protein